MEKKKTQGRKEKGKCRRGMMIKVGFDGECKKRISCVNLNIFLNWIIEDVEFCEMKDKAFSTI